MDWKKRIEEAVHKVTDEEGPTTGSYVSANVEAIVAAVTGRGPDDTLDDPKLGARASFNIPAVQLPAFCAESETRRRSPGGSAIKPYKNGYDLGKYHVGEDSRQEPPKTREIFDRALPLARGDASDVYFGAVEINGSGVRFYGDICLVLRPTAVPPDTVVLERIPMTSCGSRWSRASNRRPPQRGSQSKWRGRPASPSAPAAGPIISGRSRR
jgi:hypothetical protein